MGTDQLANLRYQDKACITCKFYREHITVAITSECLLHGCTLSIAPNDSSYQQLFESWSWMRLCDCWEKRPRKWVVRSTGASKNPHWVDPYLSRKWLKRLRNKTEKRLLAESKGRKRGG